MRVLLISPNRLRLVVPPLPIGLAGVAAAVKDRHQVRVVDLMFAEDPEAEVRRAVAEFEPEVIALSLRNIDNQDSRHPLPFFPEVRDLVTRLRGETKAAIVVGGAGFSIVPQAFMEFLGADFGLAGEGEEAFRFFLEEYGAGRDWPRVPGLVWRQGQKWRLNPIQRAPDLMDLPPPALEYFTPRRYQEAEGSAKMPGMIPVQSRRGCPMKCIYCTTPLLEGQAVRAWPPQEVAARLAGMHEKWGLTRFYFVDNMFNYPIDYAKRLCLAILDLKLPLQWASLLNPAYPDRELIGLMRQAGAVMAQVGNESGSELVLTTLGKGFGREQVEATLQMLQEEGLPFSCFLMMGGPGETPDTIRESVALLERYEPRLVNLTVGVRIYPGLPLAKQALAEGMIKPEDSLLWPQFYLAPAIKDWIWGYLEGVTARHPNWIF